MSDDLHDSHELRDESLERIVRELRPLPSIDPAAKARVLVAVAAERKREDEAATKRRGSPIRVAAMLALVAALIFVVVLSRGDIGDRRPTRDAAYPNSTTASRATPGRSAVSAADTKLASADPAAEAMRVNVQLVVRAPSARRMSVVGDFTGWDEGRVAMTRDAASGLWSATVSVRPGRHVYAFIADDSIWMRDPRAPVATDPDFGRPGSLLLVGRP